MTHSIEGVLLNSDGWRWYRYRDCSVNSLPDGITKPNNECLFGIVNEIIEIKANQTNEQLAFLLNN
jgi:hypothetical protein